MKNFYPTIAGIVCTALLLVPCAPLVRACGPFSTEPLFGFTKHPEYPLEKFAASSSSNVGVVPNSYGRAYLYAAYRQLNDSPLSPPEQKEIVELWRDRIGISESASPAAAGNPANSIDSLQKWQEARRRVFGADAKAEISTDRRVKPDDYSFFPNCHADAFARAAATLEDRIAKYGANSESVRDWLGGQDIVFANCSEGNNLPTEVTGDAAMWLQKDRAYQFAAAEFYRQNHSAARVRFERIAADSNSEWNRAANYLIARTYIRQASFAEDAAQNKQLLGQAEAHLNRILTDAAMNEYHESAGGLLALVKYRLRPEERLRELAGILVQPNANVNLDRDLTDYLLLLDRSETKAMEAANKYDYSNRSFADRPVKERADDLTDWLYTYQTLDAEAFAHSYRRWKETNAAHWFLAALSQTDHARDGEKTGELLAAANRTNQNSPAYATARYHQIRILLEQNKRAEARRKLDETFAANFAALPLSTQNLFRAQRTIVAENLTDFLQNSQRRAATFINGDDGNEAGFDIREDKELGAWADRAMFDHDAASVFNEKTPLAVLREAALSPTLPEHLKKFLTGAVWSRAVILGNTAVEREFAPLMRRYSPEFEPHLKEYAEANTAADREAALLRVILRYPVITPFVETGYGRTTAAPESIDSIRGNWWCSHQPTNEDEENKEKSVQEKRREFLPDPSFLTAAQIAEAAAERKRIADTGNSATYLARRALEFVKSNASHSAAPELLHLAVRSTRYGCQDCETGKLSKAAHDLLKARYARSEWTTKTPYWFKDASCETQR